MNGDILFHFQSQTYEFSRFECPVQIVKVACPSDPNESPLSLRNIPGGPPDFLDIR